MAAGSFEINLTSDALPVAHSLTDSLRLNDQAYGHVLVFPTRLDPADYADADLFDLSVFTGIYRLQEDRTTLRGMHASGWLGDPNDKGDLYETAVTATTNLTSWVAALKPASLYAGTYTTGSGPVNLDWSVIAQSPRKALDYIVDAFGVEWQVTDTLTLNVGTTNDLYGTVPTAVATPWLDGRDIRYTGIRATIGSQETAEDYFTRAIALDNTGTVWGADNTATTYKDGRGNTLVVKRQVSIDQDNTAAAAFDVALGQINRTGAAAEQISAVTTDAFCPMEDIECGALLYVYDPDRYVYDLDRAITFAGALMYPMRRRVTSITMALRQGMGVVFRNMDAEYTDLSDHVAWESGTSRLEVGMPPPTLGEAMRRTGVRA